MTITAADFAVFEPAKQRDSLFNEARRLVRAKLIVLGKQAQRALQKQGLKLDARTSISHPYSYNAYRVDSLWFYLMRARPDRQPLMELLGNEFREDLDPNYLHLLFFGEIHQKGFSAGLRIHERAWWDTQNLSNLLKDGTRREAFSTEVRKLKGFRMRIHDYQKIYRSEEMTPGMLQTFGQYFKPGEHRFTLWTEYEAVDPRLLQSEWGSELSETLCGLSDLYRRIAWSPENNLVFPGGIG